MSILYSISILIYLSISIMNTFAQVAAAHACFVRCGSTVFAHGSQSDVQNFTTGLQTLSQVLAADSWLSESEWVGQGWLKLVVLAIGNRVFNHELARAMAMAKALP